MRNAGLDEAQAGIKIARRNISDLRYADDTTLMAESEEELKSLLMKVKEVSEKVGLKHSIQKTKIMASGLITSWQINGKAMKTPFKRKEMEENQISIQCTGLELFFLFKLLLLKVITANIFKKTKIMASGPITSWQIDGETMETVGDFIFLGSKITADGDHSHEIKRHLLLEEKL